MESDHAPVLRPKPILTRILQVFATICQYRHSFVYMGRAGRSVHGHFGHWTEVCTIAYLKQIYYNSLHVVQNIDGSGSWNLQKSGTVYFYKKAHDLQVEDIIKNRSFFINRGVQKTIAKMGRGAQRTNRRVILKVLHHPVRANREHRRAPV